MAEQTKNTRGTLDALAKATHVLTKATMVVAAALLTIVAYATPSAAQVAAPEPSFVSPSGGSDPLGGSYILAEVDHQGLDIFSGWLFAGSTPGASDYAQVHMAANETAWVAGLPDGAFETVYFTYAYLEVDATWKRITTVADTQAAPFIEEPADGLALISDGPMEVIIGNFNLATESSWILVGSFPFSGDLAQQHLGTADAAFVPVPPDLFEFESIFVTYYWQVDGLWYSDAVQLDTFIFPPIFQT